MAPLSVSAPAATRRSRAKSDRRSQLIAAAERLVAERGYLAVRLEDIGAAAGVSGPAIYRHFPNKEALLVELAGGDQYPAAGRRHRRRRAGRRPCRCAGRAHRLPLGLRARRIRPDPHSGPRPRSSSTDRQAAGAKGAAAIRRDLGRRAAAVGRHPQRGRRPADGARDIRVAEFDTTQRETRCRENGRGQLACRLEGNDGRCADLGRSGPMASSTRLSCRRRAARRIRGSRTPRR